MATELLDFHAEWCGPCKVMEPIIDQIKTELAGQVEVKKIDVDNESDVASQHGVMSIPTFIILKDGTEVERFIGSQPKDDLVKKIQAHLS